MGYGKWIGGIVGFMAAGPLGALAGYAIGAMLENNTETDYHTTGRYTREESSTYGQRNSFMFSLLVMASYIIRADGKIMHSEMEYVRQFLRRNFGEAAVTEGNQILLNLFEQRKRMDANNPQAFRNTIYECGVQIKNNLGYEERLQLLNFLAQIAKCDGNVCKEEIEALKEVALSMGLSAQEVDSMLNLGGKTLDDRVATLGEDVKKAAEEKFQQINNAKEMIYKARGMK